MDTSELYASGLVERDEEIAGCYKATHWEASEGYLDLRNWYHVPKDKDHVLDGMDYIRDTRHGFLVLTNKRLLFVQKPSSLFSKSKGYDLVYSVAWTNVMSVYTSGFWWFKELYVATKIKDTVRNHRFDCGKEVKQIAEKMVALKGKYVDNNRGSNHGQGQCNGYSSKKTCEGRNHP